MDFFFYIFGCFVIIGTVVCHQKTLFLKGDGFSRGKFTSHTGVCRCHFLVALLTKLEQKLPIQNNAVNYTKEGSWSIPCLINGFIVFFSTDFPRSWKESPSVCSSRVSSLQPFVQHASRVSSFFEVGIGVQPA